jgi:hypothetical protein
MLQVGAIEEDRKLKTKEIALFEKDTRETSLFVRSVNNIVGTVE